MRSVTEEVGGRENRPLGDLLGNVLGRDIAHLQVAALDGDEFGALLEEVAAVIGLQLEVSADSFGKFLGHLGADILLRKDGRKLENRLVLSQRRNGEHCRSQHGCAKQMAACEIEHHVFSSCLFPVHLRTADDLLQTTGCSCLPAAECTEQFV